jgi:hydroxylamine reductase (hybrid-cluster protein)
MEGVRQLEPTPSAKFGPKDELQVEITRRNFVRAVLLAQQYQCPREEIRRLQELALKQMASEYRNAIALRNLAEEWGFSKAELESLLMKALAEHESRADKKRSEQCYDATTGKYLTLRQWVEQFLNVKK